MPLGVILNTLAIALGGVIGAKSGDRLSEEFKDKLNSIFAVCSMGMGIVSIVQMENMPAVIFSLIFGTAIGVLLHLGSRIESASVWLQRRMTKLLPGANAGAGVGDTALLVTAIVLFCSSGTGIYGSIVSGMSGDHSILISKSILDLFTALIFACSLGAVVSAIALPQFAVFMLLFACAKLIYPLTTPTMIHDFKACGGFIMLATGFRIAKLKQFPIADMIPAMAIVWPVSWLWTTLILPLLSV